MACAMGYPTVVPYAANTVRNVALFFLRKNEAHYMFFSIKKVSWKREIQCILSFYKKQKYVQVHFTDTEFNLGST